MLVTGSSKWACVLLQGIILLTFAFSESIDDMPTFRIIMAEAFLDNKCSLIVGSSGN